ncbi:hypothetical protein [Natronobacterium gregoryi]|uniref:Uncharacterized protein n=2 Tax=Natronobacterium gregoryi TaxID=44930 RepID=L0AF74_NATGS|nr:hypothetical protein [Natronobacterium gregoryi]AFZ71700.1 hypothetical protein Natgr_0445 [Natronobacterium gregoryi SP2]ELY72728.1 hypothetical protein C490_02798 [Natronobacterium gregoryi SP2]PLK20252.1 hypothetical protein CYV19_10500 [Natronobacterium gregoryi SP2]SFJ26049.1 hypothetical protein SAMN05443661_11940 [Natronobacterium gregoryi]
MSEHRTVADILERVRESRRRKRCPDCENVVTIRGFRGEYQWTCLGCDAVGFGYTSRSDVLEALEQRRNRSQ